MLVNLTPIINWTELCSTITQTSLEKGYLCPTESVRKRKLAYHFCASIWSRIAFWQAHPAKWVARRPEASSFWAERLLWPIQHVWIQTPWLSIPRSHLSLILDEIWDSIRLHCYGFLDTTSPEAAFGNPLDHFPLWPWWTVNTLLGLNLPLIWLSKTKAEFRKLSKVSGLLSASAVDDFQCPTDEKLRRRYVRSLEARKHQKTRAT